MKALRIVVWIAIVIAFVRGLFVFDMGPSAEGSYPTASGICLAGAVVAAALMVVAATKKRDS